MNGTKTTRVLIVATSPESVGGQSIQARRLIDAFQGDDEIEMQFVPNDPPTPFRSVKYLRTIVASVRFWASLVWRVPSADIVHVFSSAMTGYLIATLPPLIVARLFGVPVLLNYHSGELREHIEEWPATALPSMRRTEKIVVPSRFLAEIFAEHGLRAESIANIVDAEKFRFRERSPLSPVFVSNRNLEAHYNVGDVLRAFKLIRESVPEARLIVAGDGTESESLREMEREMAIGNVEFLGRVEPDAMPQVLDSADVYLNTSVVDNMPLSFIEAFAAGLPVVSYATGGIPYIVSDGENGILVKQGDYADLAARAVALVNDPDLAIRIAANARRESEKYTFESVKDAWKKAYRER